MSNWSTLLSTEINEIYKWKAFEDFSMWKILNRKISAFYVLNHLKANTCQVHTR